METIQDWVTLIKDIATLAAAVVAASVALAWRQQFTWKIKYELAQRLIQATYKLREVLTDLRNPVGIIGEDNPRATLEKRWQKVKEARMELDYLSLEAEAIWEGAFKESLTLLEGCLQILNVKLRTHFLEMEHPEIVSRVDDKNENIMYAWRGKKNSFTDEINEGVESVEKFLKPYLKI